MACGTHRSEPDARRTLGCVSCPPLQQSSPPLAAWNAPPRGLVLQGRMRGPERWAAGGRCRARWWHHASRMARQRHRHALRMPAAICTAMSYKLRNGHMCHYDCLRSHSHDPSAKSSCRSCLICCSSCRWATRCSCLSVVAASARRHWRVSEDDVVLLQAATHTGPALQDCQGGWRLCAAFCCAGTQLRLHCAGATAQTQALLCTACRSTACGAEASTATGERSRHGSCNGGRQGPSRATRAGERLRALHRRDPLHGPPQRGRLLQAAGD